MKAEVVIDTEIHHMGIYICINDVGNINKQTNDRREVSVFPVIIFVEKILEEVLTSPPSVTGTATLFFRVGS